MINQQQHEKIQDQLITSSTGTNINKRQLKQLKKSSSQELGNRKPLLNTVNISPEMDVDSTRKAGESSTSNISYNSVAEQHAINFINNLMGIAQQDASTENSSEKASNHVVESSVEHTSEAV